MILDEQGLFSDKQAIKGTCVSTNVLDMGYREVAFGTPVDLFIHIAETFNNLTSLTIKVQSAKDEDFSDVVDLAEETILSSKLVKGATSAIKFLPKGNLGYVRLSYTVAGSAPTEGKILAGIVDGVQESFHNV